MECCVTLGFAAVDTRSNADETARWLAQRKYSTLRLVTTDWHMRRAAGELQRASGDDITVMRDAVPSSPTLGTLFLEYHKLWPARSRAGSGFDGQGDAMITLARNLLFYPLFYIGSVPIVLSGFLSLPLGQRAVRAVTHIWTAWHRWCVRWLLGIEVRVEGEMLDRPCIYAMKHESFFEAIDAPHLFHLPAPFAKSELFAIPGWGRVAKAYGLVEVARADGARALRQMLAEARKRSQEGRPLVIFPEGTRTPHDRRAPLQPGFLGIYKLLSLPVVPVSVDSGPLYQPALKRSGIITYRFGTVIEPGLPRAEVEPLVQDGINALGEEAQGLHQAAVHLLHTAPAD